VETTRDNGHSRKDFNNKRNEESISYDMKRGNSGNEKKGGYSSLQKRSRRIKSKPSIPVKGIRGGGGEGKKRLGRGG